MDKDFFQNHKIEALSVSFILDEIKAARFIQEFPSEQPLSKERYFS